MPQIQKAIKLAATASRKPTECPRQHKALCFIVTDDDLITYLRISGTLNGNRQHNTFRTAFSYHKFQNRKYLTALFFDTCDLRVARHFCPTTRRSHRSHTAETDFSFRSNSPNAFAFHCLQLTPRPGNITVLLAQAVPLCRPMNACSRITNYRAL
jgi:hypothetical protein